ncbi:hypothetical protein, partial [uncultured Thiodictyon sp.]|uniref:InlB B-repeat-containing protein n=1 Tax=uncultured Thiodictyon sp. TaxID=1846217 RepID=UPI0025E623A8
AIAATASPAAGGTASCTPNPADYDGTSTCSATPTAGYTFSAWSGDCTGANCVLNNVTAAKAVTATFTRNSYAVTATASPAAGGTASCTPNPVDHGTSSTCSATPTAGYTFSAWSGDCTGASCVLSNVTAAKAVTATFMRNSYVITASASPAAGGAVSCTPNPADYDGTSTCGATPNAGYTFSAWSGDCTGASCVLSNVTAAKAVAATFSLNTYAITATAAPAAGGVASCTPNPVDYGATSLCTASANTGYTFMAWSGDCTGAGTSCTLTNVTAAKSVTANFGYNIAASVSPAGAGTVSCTPNPVAPGDASTCPARASPGYVFAGWRGDCAGRAGTICTLSNITSAKTAVATYVPMALVVPSRGGWRATLGR